MVCLLCEDTSMIPEGKEIFNCRLAIFSLAAIIVERKRKGGLYMTHIWGHFRTITRHRHLVMLHCFRVGLYRRGLCHDLSKYSLTEFRVGAKYYTGTRSPNAYEREAIGCSLAWMHHKGRNKHHFEYWTDLHPVELIYKPVPMPTVYLVESVMDRIAACKVYKGKNYTTASPIEYLQKANDTKLMHPDTVKKLEFLLQMLRDKGEEQTFRFIRKVVLKEVPFEQWQEKPEDHC